MENKWTFIYCTRVEVLVKLYFASFVPWQSCFTDNVWRWEHKVWRNSLVTMLTTGRVSQCRLDLRKQVLLILVTVISVDTARVIIWYSWLSYVTPHPTRDFILTYVTPAYVIFSGINVNVCVLKRLLRLRFVRNMDVINKALIFIKVLYRFTKAASKKLKVYKTMMSPVATYRSMV